MTTSRAPSRHREPSVERATPGAVVGRLVSAPDAGAPVVDVPGHGAHRARVLRSVDRGWLRGDGAVGREVLLVLADGDPARPIIIGVLEDLVDTLLDDDADAPRIDVSLDGRAVTLEATREITLRCGEASLTLHADGRVVTRGVNVVSQASEQQRIAGAIVRIN